MIQDIGYAVAALKDGRRVARQGWNGKGMFLTLITPGEHDEDSLLLEYANGIHVGLDDAVRELKVDPCIAMKTAGNTLQPGWLASQADLLAEDWVVLD